MVAVVAVGAVVAVVVKFAFGSILHFVFLAIVPLDVRLFVTVGCIALVVSDAV
jgi:hypothetical protein